jgi:hypothetical protein
MFNFSQIFPSTKKPNRRVRAKRSMIMKLASGETTTVAAGDEFEITHDEASKLDSGDVVFLDPINKPEPPKIEPAPERPEPRPAPEAWAKLPACFTEWHNLNERFRVALEHGRLIVEKRVEIFGTTTSIGDPEGSAATLLVLRMKPFERGGGTVFTNKIRLDDEQVRLQDAALNSAAKKAADHLEELRRDYTLKLQKLHLQCGWERLSTADQATKLARQVRQIGIDLFSMRVAALELHPGQVARLYNGSALFQKYGMVQDAPVRNVCFAGHDESAGTMRTYIDDAVSSIASFMLSDLRQLDALEPLFAEGHRELTKAKKAAAA